MNKKIQNWHLLKTVFLMFISVKSLAQTTNFSYTGAVQTYTVPAGVTQLTVTLKGASGGNATWGTATGGLGATVTGTITVTPGSTINVYVGGQSGWNGGGAAGNATATQGGGGGDASDIRIGGTALTDRVLVAGGGGGAGGGGMTYPSTLYGAGGNGGNSNSAGSSGSGYPFPVVGGTTPSGPTIGGQGGTVGGGGIAGTGCAPASGTAGAVNGTGGNGFNLGNPTVKYPSGGGGGGGYVNGGGGGGGTAGTVNCTLNDNNAGGGGAGGSNFTGTATNTTVIDGNNTGNGSVSITVILSPPTITSFTPKFGNIGSTVTITGSNFTGATKVWFGATPATSFNVVNSTTITAVVPPNAYLGTIAVSTNSGFVISKEDYRVNNPQNVQFESAEGLNFALKNGKLYTWGGGTTSIFYGDSSTTTYSKNCPVEVPLKGSLKGKTIAQFALGVSHVIVLASDGTVHSWGSNYTGVLGIGSSTHYYVPIEITNNGSLIGKTIVQVAAGEYASYALASDGSVHSWGDAIYGVLGNGSSTTGMGSSLPINVSANGSLNGKTILKLFAGKNNIFCIASDSTIHAFGNNLSGNLGIGNAVQNQPSPVEVLRSTSALNGKLITSMSVSSTGALFLDNSGLAYATGSLNLATGNTLAKTIAINVTASSSLNNRKILKLASSSYSSAGLALDTAGKLHSWGEATYGFLANSTTTPNTFTPAFITVTGSSIEGKLITNISSGYIKASAQTADSTFHTWGNGIYGGLGIGQNGINYSTTKLVSFPTKPTIESSNLVFSGITNTSATITFTPGNGDRRMVILKATNPISNFAPSDGVVYSANSIFTSGGIIDGNARVVYAGTGNTVTVTGLTFNTIYNVAVFEYFNSTAPCNLNYYKFGSPLTGNFTANILPITLSSFTATAKEKSALLNWQSKSEINALEYVIERSTNGKDFDKIITVSAVGKANDYALTDDRLPSTVDNKLLTLYYRLRMVDKDGKYSYSEVRKLEMRNNKLEISIYPNPVKGDKLNIDFGEDINAKTQYTITSTDGRIVQQGFVNNRQETININFLSPSIYILKVENKKPVMILKQ